METGNDEKAFQSIHDLASGMRGYDQTPEAWSLDLRLDLAEIILRALKRTGWTRTKLAEKAGMYPAALTKVLHSDQNWSVDTATRLLHALGERVRLIEIQENATFFIYTGANTDGEENQIGKIRNGRLPSPFLVTTGQSNGKYDDSTKIESDKPKDRPIHFAQGIE